MKLLALAAMLAATSSAVAPETLTHARVIRAEVGAKYRLAPGRKLSVTEATSTAVVESITLITDWLEPPRVVAAANGIYFAICSARAKCPYPRRSAAWRPLAFRPRGRARPPYLPGDVGRPRRRRASDRTTGLARLRAG